jgi:hypothetical protein
VATDLHLPRSVLLACWLWGSDGRAAAAVPLLEGTDEPHLVVGGPWPDLPALLAATGVERRDVAAVLPAPGDAIVGPREAVGAGEAVLLGPTHDGGRALALVPQVERFGSDLEPGHRVSWHVMDVPDWRTAILGVVGSLDEAERGLADGLRIATGALVRLDVAHWPARDAERIAAVRDGVLPARRLPPRLAAEPRRVRVLTQAARLRAIVDLARRDDGGAVNGWQADQRSTALREVDRLARRAMGAAASRLTAPRAAGGEVHPFE